MATCPFCFPDSIGEKERLVHKSWFTQGDAYYSSLSTARGLLYGMSNFGGVISPPEKLAVWPTWSRLEGLTLTSVAKHDKHSKCRVRVILVFFVWFS